MSLRKAYGSALQKLRTHLGLSQQSLSDGATQTHVSHLEAGRKTASLSVTLDLARELGVEPGTFLTLILAALEGRSPGEVIHAVSLELERLKLTDARVAAEPENLPHPLAESAREKWERVHALKRDGFSQADIVSALGIPKVTVSRLWHKAPK